MEDKDERFEKSLSCVPKKQL